MSDPKALAVLYFVANARRHAGAKKGYYGNCVTMQLARATSGAVANADVMDLVKMIQCAKARLPDQSDMDELLLQQPHCLGYNLLGMSCWRNIGLQVPDFGAGRPARVTCYWQEQDRTTLPFCIPCIPCKDDHNVLSICVREEHAGAFRQELALMHRIIHNPAVSSKL